MRNNIKQNNKIHIENYSICILRNISLLVDITSVILENIHMYFFHWYLKIGVIKQLIEYLILKSKC